MTADEVHLQLVNTNQLEPRRVVVQAGGYAEHEFTGVSLDDRSVPVNGRHVSVALAPGAGSRLTLRMKRYVHQPTLRSPWDR
jgi:hypothetical protein